MALLKGGKTGTSMILVKTPRSSKSKQRAPKGFYKKIGAHRCSDCGAYGEPMSDNVFIPLCKKCAVMRS